MLHQHVHHRIGRGDPLQTVQDVAHMAERDLAAVEGLAPGALDAVHDAHRLRYRLGERLDLRRHPPFDWSALSAAASSSRALFASCAGSDMNPPRAHPTRSRA